MTGFFTGVIGLDDLEQVVRVGLLYDQYGPLLTARQREVVDLYYLRNWSLQEIAEAWQTSRQAVHDLLGRSVRLLEGYERKLGLEAREHKARWLLGSALDRLREARGAFDYDRETARAALAGAEAAVKELLEAL